MAWVWWLTAPVAATVFGSLLLWWHGQREVRGASLQPGNAIDEHRALLAVLARVQHDAPDPVNMLLLPPPADGRRTTAS
jgi:hypothetical protein